MYARADDLKKMLDDVQPSWDAVAAVLPTTDDVKDGSGKRPNGERVRKTWYKVRQAKRWDKPRHTSTAGKATPAPVEAKPLSARERQPSSLLPPSATAPVGHPADHNTHPRERKRLVLHSPIPLAEGEPAPNDGSRLPAPYVLTTNRGLTRWPIPAAPTRAT